MELEIATEKLEMVWPVYMAAYLKIPEDNRRRMKNCEYQIRQMERRIARKKNLELHQILNDMKPLHVRAAEIGYMVSHRNHKLLGRYKHTLRRLARLDLNFLEMMSVSVSLSEILQIPDISVKLREKSLYEIYKEDYMQFIIGRRIEELMKAEPEKQYPQARSMHRHFILHIGPTNSGKTYQALERLKRAYQGIYLGPLRLWHWKYMIK